LTKMPITSHTILPQTDAMQKDSMAASYMPSDRLLNLTRQFLYMDDMPNSPTSESFCYMPRGITARFQQPTRQAGYAGEDPYWRYRYDQSC
jgi:hypothetical protein